jgi:hypothetical protein
MNAAKAWSNPDGNTTIMFRSTGRKHFNKSSKCGLHKRSGYFQVKSRLPNSVRTVRLEDLTEDPVRIMAERFGFLDLDLPPEAEEVIADCAYKYPNQRHQGFNLRIPLVPIGLCRPTIMALIVDDTKRNLRNGAR